MNSCFRFVQMCTYLKNDKRNLYVWKPGSNLQKVIGTIMGWDRSQALRYINKFKLNNTKPERIAQIVDALKHVGNTPYDIFQCPKILTFSPRLIQQRSMVMEETGFKDISPQVVLKFAKLQKKSIGYLKQQGYIDEKINISEHCLKYLDIKPDMWHITYDDSITWRELHTTIFTEYLRWRLDASNIEIEKLFHSDPDIKYRSFRLYCENIKLATEIGFTKQRILKYAFLFRNNASQTYNSLERFETVAGANLKSAMNKYPKLMTMSPDSIEQMYNMLKGYNISDEIIRHRMNIFALSPVAVKSKLETLMQIPNLRVLSHSKQWFLLLLHHSRAHNRLDFLKIKDWDCVGIRLLSVDDSKFDSCVKEGQNRNSLAELFSFVNALFKRNVSDDVRQLMKHPFYRNVSFVQMQELYNYLKERGFTDAVILKVIYILLYPKQKVEYAINDIPNHGSASDLQPETILNIALYLLEKDHHFTGNGIWGESGTNDDLTPC